MKQTIIGIAVVICFAGCADNAEKLVVAAHKGDSISVRQLLQKGADPCAAQPKNGWTPLHIAAAEGHADIVEMILEAGAPIDSKSQVSGMKGAEAIFFAAMYGHTNVIALLADKGANLNNAFEGRTPSQLAEYSQQPHAARFIEEQIKQKEIQPRGSPYSSPAAGSESGDL